jgi:SNF2 family DNA or RNA helicase
MQYNPLPFQQKAIALVCEKPGSALLLDPGMGKTAITLAAHCVLQHHKAIQATLVIVPLRPMYLTWPAEVAKWDQFKHLKVSIIHGTAEQRRKAMITKADIYLINPENVAWLTEALQQSLGALAGMWGTVPGLLVVDESTRFKNGQSKRFKALKTILPLFPRRTILTGTPAPQSIEDLFAQMNIVDDGQRLGRYITYFRKLFMYSTPLRIGGGRTIDEWHVRPGGAHMVAEAIKDVALRLQAEDYLTMPAISYNVIPVELPKAVRSVYKAMADDLVAAVGDQKITAVTAAAATMKLRQITNGWAYSEDGSVKVHDAKLDALADLVEEQQGTPLLVAVAFLHEVPAIRERLASVLPKGTHIPYLGGGVSRLEADKAVARWNEGEYPVLLAHPTSVAHGLNLQAGGHAVCWFGLTWNLEEHIQLNARVYRQGQTKPVVIHYLTAKDTVDESIAKALVDKSDLQSAILNRLKGAK